jgi:putative acetyltransferase
MRALFAEEDNHYLEISELCADHIRFFAAWEGETALGCAALALYPAYGEVKSMFVAPEARGKGIGMLLLKTLEAEATASGLATLNLETGNTLYDAHRLYERAGFTLCGAFGDYAESPASLFMTKTIA